MSAGDFLTLATLALAILVVTPFLGALHPPGDGGRANLPEPGPPARRAGRSTACAASTRPPSRAGRATRSRCSPWPSSRSSPATSCCGSRTSCRSTRAASRAMSPDLAFNTSVSFETNTNWQNYSGETGATYLTQAAMLAVRNFTSAATGLAIAIALIRGLTRRSAQDARQLLGRPDPRRPVHPAADLDRRRARPRLAGRAPDVGPDRDRRRRSRARSRPSPSGRSPPRNGSRSWATTAAGSSTPTRPIRSRTRRR